MPKRHRAIAKSAKREPKVLEKLIFACLMIRVKFESMLSGQIELDYRGHRVLCSDVELDGMAERVFVEYRIF